MFKKRKLPTEKTQPEHEKHTADTFDIYARVDDEGRCVHISAHIAQRVNKRDVNYNGLSGNYGPPAQSVPQEDIQFVHDNIIRHIRYLNLINSRINIPVEYRHVDEIREYEYLRSKIGLPESPLAAYLHDNTIQPGPRRDNEGMMLMMVPVPGNEEDIAFIRRIRDHFGHTEESVAAYWDSL